MESLCFALLDSFVYRKKYEIATTEVGNPIKQDEKKGILREVRMHPEGQALGRFGRFDLFPRWTTTLYFLK
jgi:hypothetical protein